MGDSMSFSAALAAMQEIPVQDRNDGAVLDAADACKWPTLGAVFEHILDEAADPLCILQGHCLLLRRKLQGTSDGGVCEAHIAAIERALGRMTLLMNDLQALSTMRQSK